jgi:hypothetical protein
LIVDRDSIRGTELGRILGQYQALATPGPGTPAEDEARLRCRDLAQGIAQFASLITERLTVFISHTKHSASDGEEDVLGLVSLVRQVISQTRLAEFFDTHDLLPGQNWDERLREQAAMGALLAIRTDLYASREWCQREMSIAKVHGLPVVIMDSLGLGEERGSYLMDHVARIPVQMRDGQWDRDGILRCLNLLVDEALKRILWRRQEQLAEGVPDLNVTWWAPHAPEPITLTPWLVQRRSGPGLPVPDRPIRILHPDPPLGPEEVRILVEVLRAAGVPNDLDIMTPRILAARGF